jgi:DNA-binding MarR family transcriptional regulator
MRIESFLKQSPIFQANRIARKMEASMNRVLQAEQLTLFEAMILAAIFLEKKGVIKPSSLAEAFQTTRANVSHCVSSLEAKALLQRTIDPEDARAFQLTLQRQGRRRAVRVVAILDRTQRQFEETFGVTKLEGMLAQMCAVEELCARLAQPAPRAEE